MSVTSQFWSGRRVFLTGHTGFKGSWLSLWLQSLGAEVTGYSLAPNTNPSLFDVARVSEGMVSHIGDIRDGDHLEQAMQDSQPEIVLHLAAQPLVRLSYKDPLETYSINVMGLAQVFEACRKIDSIQAILNVTSDKCYENNEWVWAYRENDAMGGYDPYSSSKGCAELVTSAYRRSFFAEAGVALGSARAGNVIGGGDWADDRLIPDALRSFGAGEPLIVRNPKAERPWQHVLEPLSGYLALAERLFNEGQDYAEGWNFGPPVDQAWSVDRIADGLTEVWGQGASWQQSGEAGPHEAHLLALESTKAYRRFGWTSRWSIFEALEHTVSWQKAFLDGADMKALCLEQVKLYQNSNQKG